jgi:hypothetical protein
MQKRVFRILMGIGYRDSCRKLFKEEKILTFPSQYIFSLLLFVNHNMSLFIPNSVYHDINTRQKNNLHVPHAHRTMYQKGALYSGIKVFNALPSSIKTTSNNPKKIQNYFKALFVVPLLL